MILVIYRTGCWFASTLIWKTWDEPPAATMYVSSIGSTVPSQVSTVRILLTQPRSESSYTYTYAPTQNITSVPYVKARGYMLYVPSSHICISTTRSWLDCLPRLDEPLFSLYTTTFLLKFEINIQYSAVSRQKRRLTENIPYIEPSQVKRLYFPK